MNRKKIVVFSVLIPVIAAAVFFIIVRSGNIEKLNYTMNLSAEVDSAVSVSRDRRGIPSIKADNPRDMFFALGFVHAQDRLPLMEYYRSIADGSADTVIPGEDGKTLSKLVSILEIQKKAAQININLKEPYRTFIIRYVDGINAAKEKIRNPSFVKKGGNDRPWTADDCIAYYIFIEWTSSFLNNYELVFPVDANKSSSALNDLVEKDTICPYTEKESPYVKDMKKLYDLLRGKIGVPGKGIAVSVNKTQNRQDSVAVKYASISNIFPLYYPLLINISGKEKSVISCSGMPFFMSSVSGDLSFARFCASLDCMDLYLVPNVQKSGEDMYNTGYEWKTFEKKALPIRLGGEIVRETETGPVISDIFPKKNDSLCLILDKPYSDESSVAARFDLQFASNMQDALRALSADQGYPSAVMLSKGFESASILSGNVPVRPVKNIFSRDRISPVAKRNLSSVRKYLKKEFFFVSESVTAKDVPELSEYAVFSAKPIADDLDDMTVSDLSFQRMSEIMNGSESSALGKISGQLLKMLENVPVTSAKLSRMYLGDWKGDLSGEKVSPTILFQTVFSLLSEVLSDDIGGDIDSVYRNPSLVLGKITSFLENGNSSLYDNRRTTDDVETGDRIFNASFLNAMRILHRAYGPEIEKWKWSRISNPVLQMPNVRGRGVFEGPSRGYLSEGGAFNGSVIYNTDNKMAFIPESDAGLLKTDILYWSSDFAISMDPRSQFYSDRLIPPSVNPFDSGDAQFILRISPFNGASKNNSGGISK
jgi:penicillin amidase